MRRFVPLLMLLTGLAACAHAGAERGKVFESPGAFRIGIPGKDWKIRRNRRVGSRLLLDYARIGADVDIRVTVHPIDMPTRRLPLPTLAEALMRNWGRSQGLETDIEAIQRVDFGAHEGIVVFANRHWSGGGKKVHEAAE